jgi:hypothetical protein
VVEGGTRNEIAADSCSVGGENAGFRGKIVENRGVNSGIFDEKKGLLGLLRFSAPLSLKRPRKAG